MTRLALSLALLVLFTGAALADARSDAEAKKSEGDKLAKEKKDAEALAAYEAAMNLDATYQAAYDAASTLWFKAKDYDRAIARLEPAVKAAPDYAKGWYNLAFAYRKTSRFEDSVTAYKAFIQLAPSEPDPYYGLGLVYQALGKTDEARAALTIYIKLETRPEKQKFVNQAKAELAKLGEAKPATEEVAKTPDAAALELEGDTLRAAGDVAGAEAKYRAAIAADATYQPAHNELGALLYDAGKLDEAIGFLEQAVTLDPKDKTAWYNLAHARRMAGRHADAADAYRRYIEFNPAEADPYYGLGYALEAASW